MTMRVEIKLSAKWGRLLAACIGTLLLSLAPAGAQTNRFSRLADAVFSYITKENGLPNEVPLALAQDSEGFIWMGTEGGLARWDGTHFRLYSAGPDPTDLPDNVVSVLHRDTQGHLWIGTDAAGLARYDPATDKFIRVPLNAPGQVGVAGVQAIIDDGANGLWVGTGAGLFHLNSSMHIVYELTARQAHGDPASVGLPDFAVSSLVLDRRGTLWVGTLSGLAKAQPGSTKFLPVSLPVVSRGDAACQITKLLEDSTGALWVGTHRDGAFVIGPDGVTVRSAPVPEGDDGVAAGYGVTAILEIQPGLVWLGTDGQGILEISRDEQPRSIRHDPSISTSVLSDEVRALFKDRAGLVWVASDRGISRYDPTQHAVATLFGVANRQSGISDTDVVSVMAMPDNKVWAGLRYHGIDILDVATGRIVQLPADPRHPDTALPAFSIPTMAALPDGSVLAGTADGLYRLDAAGAHIQRLTIPGRSRNRGVESICFCHGSVWLGGKDGLWQLSIDPGGQVHVLRREDGAHLTDPRIDVIAPGPDDAIWVGTESGLNLLHAGSGLVERIFPDRTDPTKLASGEIITLLTDRQGQLWVGTLDDGLFVMTGRRDGKPVFRRLGKAQGLPNEDISSLQLGPSGRIWMSTDEGIAVLDPTTFAVQSLGRNEGVAVTTYWSGSGAVTEKGEILFGGLGGLTAVTPALLTHDTYRPPLVITDVHVGGKSVLAGQPGPVGKMPAIVLGPDSNSLHVEFTLLDYAAAINDRFGYKLEGFDTDWVENEVTPRIASYTNLPPGHFVLRLRGTGHEGSWGDTQISVPVIVLPAWYQTPWFRLAALAVVALLVAALVQARTALLRQRQRELERQVAERTAELSLTQAQLRHFAYVDMLTGLPNRRAFTEEFRRLTEQAQHSHGRLALLLIDMDGFKLVNDTLGHHAGDSLLVAVGGRLRGAVREGDFVARLGGDEFAVLMMMADDMIELVCQRIIDGFLPPVAIEGENLVAGASIGVAIYPDHGATQERIYKMADIAMYAAKREGRGTWRCFEGTMQAA